MASHDIFDPLRVVTQRLSSTPSRQLPYVAPYLATTIAQCDKAFTALMQKDQANGGSESTVIVHKLKTQLSALLQDKSPEARYAAVILIKATVEVGGWDVLHGVGAWVRGLIGILGKPEPPSTKKLCIVTLTRILLLTHEHQSLVREITTPSLPGFIAACLNLMKISRSPKAVQESYVQSPLLLVVLHALSELIAMHPTSFRPFVPQIQSLTYPLIAPTPSNLGYGNCPIPNLASASESARYLFVLLHVCGPKNVAGEEWAKSLDALIISVQRTVDKVFRSLIEDFTSSTGKNDVVSSDLVQDVVGDQNPAPLALPAWTGIHAGIERLDGLLHALQAFLASTTAAAVTLPVGNILNLVDRILAAFPPGNGRKPRVKPEIDRDEREGLWVGLPRLQVSALGIYSLLISRMGDSSAAIAFSVMEQLLWVFESQYGNDGFRRAAYGLVSQILTIFGPSLPKIYATSLSRCIKICCEDLLPSVDSPLPNGQASFPKSNKPPNGTSPSTNADSYLKSKSAINQTDPLGASADVLQAARELLPLTLTNLPNAYLSFSLRCQIDRTAIITQNHKAMLASVMNPISKRQGQKQISSILPLLARAHSEALEVEILLRPQMPPIQSRRSNTRDEEPDEEEVFNMHGQPPSGETDGSFRDPVSINGDVNVEQNTIAVRHGDMQRESTPRAGEEGAPGAEPTGVPEITVTALPEPESAFSNTSAKRDREEDSDFGTHVFAEGDSAKQTNMEVANKRPRKGSQETQGEALLEPASADAPFVDASGPGQAVKNPFASNSAAVLDEQPVLRQEDSDESDFQMPILNLDSDTDEEGEEEVEEEEEEEEEEDG